MDKNKTETFVNQMWDDSIIPELCEYIKIPNKSPMFDPDWEQHGYMEQATELIEAWCRERPIEGLTVEVVRLDGRTPVIYMEIPPFACESDDTVLLYGHLDKQPEMSGWDEDLGPWKPVMRGERLYGRGGADDAVSYTHLRAHET